jgi:flagellar biosynthesis/type III secretory pathway M-ring protein FliF/YscJ
VPALPLDEAGKYVAGAYVVFVALLLIYVAIMAVRLERMRQELSELADLAENRVEGDELPATSDEQRETAGVP